MINREPQFGRSRGDQESSPPLIVSCEYVAGPGSQPPPRPTLLPFGECRGHDRRPGRPKSILPSWNDGVSWAMWPPTTTGIYFRRVMMPSGVERDGEFASNITKLDAQRRVEASRRCRSQAWQRLRVGACGVFGGMPEGITT